MAKEEKTTCKHSKRQVQIGSRGGGNIGGLLLLGGALAVGSLVATFAARKGNRQKGSGENRKRKEDQSSQGLHFVLQSPSSEFHGIQCCAGDGLTEMIEASQLVSTDNLVLEQNSSSEVNSSHENSDKRDQETLLSKDPKQDGNELCDSLCSAEEIQLPEVNIPSLDKLDKDFGNDVAEVDSFEVAEEDTVDGVKTSREEIAPVESTKKEDDDNMEEKRQAEKSSETSVEEDDSKNSTEESHFEEIIEVEQEEEEAIDEVEETLSVKSIDEEDDDEKEDNEQQVQEKSFPEEKNEVEEEGEPISLSIVDKDPVVIDNFQKELPLKDITEVEHEAKDEAAEAAMDAVKMCIEENSLMISAQDDSNTGKKLPIDEKEDRGDINLSDDDEILSKKSEDNLGGTGRYEFKTAVEANAQFLAAKTEQDEKNQSKELNCFNSSKNSSINGFTDINQTRENSTFAQKEENLDFAVSNKQLTIFTTKSGLSVEIMLMVASIVLLFITYCYGLSQPSRVTVN